MRNGRPRWRAGRRLARPRRIDAEYGMSHLEERHADRTAQMEIRGSRSGRVRMGDRLRGSVRKLGTIVAATGAMLIFAAPPSFAADDDEGPAVLNKQAGSAESVASAAALLRQRAARDGEISLIVGFDLGLRSEDELSPAAEQAQEQALRASQDGILARDLGRTSGGDIVKYDYVPAFAATVTGAELSRLIADPRVVTIEEDVAIPVQGYNTTITETDKVWQVRLRWQGRGGGDPRHRRRQDPPDAGRQGGLGSLLFFEPDEGRDQICLPLPRKSNRVDGGRLGQILQSGDLRMRPWHPCRIDRGRSQRRGKRRREGRPFHFHRDVFEAGHGLQETEVALRGFVQLQSGLGARTRLFSA